MSAAVDEIRATFSALGSRVRKLFEHAQQNNLPITLAFGNAADSGLDDATFRRNVQAVAVWLQAYVAPAWGLTAPTVVPVATGEAPPAQQDGEVLIRLQVKQSIPEAPGAAGYHEPLDPTQPWDGYVATAGLDAAGLSECMAHEGGEGEVDPPCDIVHTAPNGDIWPQEICDAVQGSGPADRIPIDLGDGQPPVYCSNFILPAYFDAGAPAGTKVDYLGLLPGPYRIGSNGYSAITHADGTTTDVFGANGMRYELPAHKQHPECRIQQRVLKMRHASIRLVDMSANHRHYKLGHSREKVDAWYEDACEKVLRGERIELHDLSSTGPDAPVVSSFGSETRVKGELTGQAGYEAWADSRGWKHDHGGRMQPWDELGKTRSGLAERARWLPPEG